MKKSLQLLLVALCVATVASAQQDDKAARVRKKYANFGYVSEKLSVSGLPGDTKSNYGASFTTGRSYYLHKKPIVGMIRIGIDATWFDVNYANYDREFSEQIPGGQIEVEKVNTHKAEIGMQVGPSITVTPINRLNAHLYFRFAPSYAAMLSDGSVSGNYASFFVTGASVSYGVIGLGVEKRWGECRYKGISGDLDEGELNDVNEKLKTSGVRAYLTLRF